MELQHICLFISPHKNKKISSLDMNIRQTIEKERNVAKKTERITTDSINNVRMTRQSCRQQLKE